MKALPIVCSVVLPILVGFLHPDVRASLSNARWPTILGMLLGFNGLFALVGGALAIVFTAKSRSKAAWVSVGIATFSSALLSASAGVIRERTEALAAQHELDRVSQWLSTSGSGTEFKLETSMPEQDSKKLKGINFSGMIANRSKEKIRSAIIDYSVINTKEKALVVTKRLMLPLDVFPTATLKISGFFTPHSYYDNIAMSEIHKAWEQLGESAGWTYELIGFVPDSNESPQLQLQLSVHSVLKR